MDTRPLTEPPAPPPPAGPLAERLRSIPDLRVLSSHEGLAGKGTLPSSGGPALPSTTALAKEILREFELPHATCRNEYRKASRDEWLRDRLRSSVLSAPASVYFARPARVEAPWWRLALPRRDDWASDVLYALVGQRQGDRWSDWLDWHDLLLFLSDDAATTMAWETTEHDLRLYLYPTDVLLERPRSRARLLAWISSAKDLTAWAGSTSDVWARSVLRRRHQISTLHASASKRARDLWLMDCLERRLAPAFDEYRLSPEQRPLFSGMAELSIGATLLPWTPVAWRDPTWLLRLWDELAPDCLFVRGVDRSHVLGIRRASRTYEAFLFAPARSGGSR